MSKRAQGGLLMLIGLSLIAFAFFRADAVFLIISFLVGSPIAGIGFGIALKASPIFTARSRIEKLEREIAELKNEKSLK